MLKQKLTELKERMVLDATKAERMIERSVQGLIERKPVILREVIEKDEPEVNRMEIEIDRMCTDLLALHQPEAGDLRTVLMILKMNGDIERMADQAVNICQHGLAVIDYGDPVLCKEDFAALAEAVRPMIRDAITAFVRNDDGLAREVCTRDDRVDGMRDSLVEKLHKEMAGKPDLVRPGLHLVRIATELERVADLTTNICEDVIYMAAGKVIKHHNL